MQLQSVLILGGAGFIGTHLARTLGELPSPPRVVSLDIKQPTAPVPYVTYLRHDVRVPLHTALSERFDVIFNLAAVHRTPGHEPHEYYETNVRGALNCVAYAERTDVENIFFTSSISVYGPSEQALDESAALNPISDYGRSKQIAEEIQREWMLKERWRRLRIVRPAVVFGPGENGNYTRLAKLLQRGLFVFPGRSDTRKAGGYVKELARTMLFALGRPEPFYLYNFADRHCPTAKEICDAFYAQGGMHRPIGTIPLPLMQLGGAVFEALNAVGLKNSISRERINKLVHSTNIVPRRLMEDGYPYAYDLMSAIGDWVANDEVIRPTESQPRAVTVPPLAALPFELPSESKNRAARRA